MFVPSFWTEESVPIGVQFAVHFGDETTQFRSTAQREKARLRIDGKASIHCSFE